MSKFSLVRFIKENSRLTPRAGAIFSLCILVVLLFLTSTVRDSLINTNREKSAAQFTFDTEELQAKLISKLENYENALQGARGLFDASDLVTREDWKSYVTALDIERNYSGIPSLAFAPVVKKDEVDSHEMSNRTLSPEYRGYTVHPQNTANDFFVPINYVESFTSRVIPSLGFDIFSEPVRHEAIKRAYETGEPALSGKIVLLSDVDKKETYASILYVPIFKKDMPKSSVEEKKAAFQGVVFAAVRMGDFVDSTLGKNKKINVVIYDTKDGAFTTKTKMYGDETPVTQNARFQKMTVGGRTWTVHYWSNTRYFVGDAQRIPNIVGGAGLILSIFLTGFMFLLLTSRERALSIAKSLNKELIEERNAAIQSQKKDEIILDGIAEGLAVYDAQGHVIKLNRVAEEMFGLAQNRVEGESYATAYPAFDQKMRPVATGDRPVGRAFNTGKAVTDTLLYERPDGSHFPILTTASPLIVDGQTIGGVAIFRDVSREQEIDRHKSEFVSLASHQLKTPIGAVNWDVQLLLDGFYGDVSDEQREALSQVQRMSLRMNDLVNSLLNVSRIEQREFSVEPREVDIKEVCEDVAEELSVRMNEKSQTISIDVHKKAENLNADKNLLRIVVHNLISNACKYSPDSTPITVDISFESNEIVFCIENEGSPIPRKEHAKIFDKMYRASNATSQDSDGSGLGLYMVNEIVNSTGGRLWFTSDDTGTRFYFAYPSSGMKAREGQNQLSI